MSLLLQVDKVKYQCFCGVWLPLCKLYFCRYCNQLRCACCTQHEADVYFCPQCLQSQMAPEAKLHDMNCRSCFECPFCQSVMSLRAVATTEEPNAAAANKSDAKTPVKKKYYLMCGYCLWSTKEVGIEEKEITALHDSFVYHENDTIKQLREAYHMINMRDDAEQQLRRAGQGARRKNIASLALKEGLTQQLLAAKINPGRNKQMAAVSSEAILQPVRSEASSTVDELPDSIYIESVDMSQVTSMQQRVVNVNMQQTSVTDLIPNRRRLAIKKSVRCTQCDHSLCKPEYSTANVKFKIQLLAQLQIPEVRIQPGLNIKLNQDSLVVLSVSNPDQLSPIEFRLTSYDEDSTANTKLTVPDVSFTLEPRNEAFSLEESFEIIPEQLQHVDFNHGSKMGIKCSVRTINVQNEQSAQVSVMLHYKMLTNTSEQQTDFVKLPVRINLGKPQS